MLKSVEDIVDALGGTTAAAHFLDLDISTVSCWKGRGHIPPHYYLAVAEELERRGLKFDGRNIFGWHA